MKTMKKNVGTIDKVIRILVALVIIALYAVHVISGTLAIVLLALSTVFILTSLCSVCPLYKPFGLSTTKENEQEIKQNI